MADPLTRLTDALADRYRFDRELGRGGMATVYLAEDLKHHRQVAIKVLKPELAAVLGPDRFLREIEISARLNHPHILPLHDSGVADGFLYYVMPYAEGESLRDRLMREKQLPVEDALQIAREVADALDYAHRHDVVHRDIKPENILLEERHAVVADFGIARAITVAGGEKLTATGVAVGTPEYMSPEQASGQSQLDGRSDTYALGCLLYEMLAGQPPFMGPTIESVVHQHLSAPPPAVTAIRAAVPALVAKVIERALAKAPADRYSTPSQFAQALTLPVAPMASAWRRPAVAIAVVAIAVLAVVGAWAFSRNRDGSASSVDDLPRVAVLPFENLGAAEDEFFADGITDEILTKLAGLSGLAVISSQSAMSYKGTTKSVEQIGRELDVRYLLQGKIRWQRLPDGSSRVRVTPRLIQVADDRNLWVSDFDEVLEDVFQVQGQIATQVASALGVTLLSREQKGVAQRPTENLASYEEYLKGNEFFRVGFSSRPPLRDAARAYEKAIALDPGFAAAHARLSMAHGGIRWGNLDPGRGDEHLAKQKEHADRALALDPALPDAHVAMGWYHYMGQREYQKALQEFVIALASEPNNSFYMSAEGTIFKRTGDWEAAAERFSRASDLDPLSPAPAAEAAYPYVRLRRYSEAERYLERYAAITGEYHRLAYVRLLREGDPAALRTWVEATLGTGGLPHLIATAAHGGSGTPEWGWAVVRGLCGPCDAAIPLVTRRRERDWQRYEGIALLHEQAGRLDQARTYYDSARVEQLELEILGGVARTTVYAKLGDKGRAVAAARQWVERARQNRDVYAEGDAIRALAEVYVVVSETEAALEQLEWLLSHPSDISVPLLRADPLYDPLRSNPRFQALLAKYGNSGRN